MKSNFHGVFSFILILSSVVLALSYMSIQSLVWGLAYLVVIMIATPVVLYAFCAKCLCRQDSCSHVFPGRLTRLLPDRKQGPYSIADYFWTALGLMVLIVFPIPWLWQSKIIFFVYGSLLIIGLAEILFLVCRTCSNVNCPLCSMSEQKIR